MELKSNSGIIEFDLIAALLIAALILSVSMPLHSTIKRFVDLKSKSESLSCENAENGCQELRRGNQSISYCSSIHDDPPCIDLKNK